MSKKKEVKKEIKSQIGNKFGKDDMKSLKDAGVSNNKILKIAASSGKVGNKANAKLSTLNPGINLPAAGVNRPMMGGSANFGAIGQYHQSRIAVGQQVKDLGKKVFQWQGTDAKGRPNALGGFKTPKKGNAYSLGIKAYNRGTFGGINGNGTYLGRDAGSRLNPNGTMKNNPVSFQGRAGGGGGGNKGEGGGGSGGEGLGISGGSNPIDSLPDTPDMPSYQSAYGTDLSGNATGFRSRKSSWRRSGKSMLGTNNLKIKPTKFASGVGLNMSGTM